MKSYMASPATIERKWYVVDAADHTLGRLSSEIASILRGKNKPTYTPSMDTGDYVIVINAEKIKVGVELAINMEYGYSIPEVTGTVQDKVKSAIETMTGLEVAEVNIRVAGVNLEDE